MNWQAFNCTQSLIKIKRCLTDFPATTQRDPIRQGLQLLHVTGLVFGHKQLPSRGRGGDLDLEVLA